MKTPLARRFPNTLENATIKFMEIKRTIKSIEAEFLLPALELVEDVFTKHSGAEEGKTVRSLVEEIRAKKYYLPELELIATNSQNGLLGYAMFSRFHLEGKYENELLLLSPVAVKTEFQRQHISKDLIEFGFEKAKRLGFKAVIVEGDPRNYTSRSFQPSHRFGITAGPAMHLPHPDCLMAMELERAALSKMSGVVDYSFYETLR